MTILLDACVPRPLRRFFPNAGVSTAQEQGWGMLRNGELLTAVEKQFNVFVTSDQNLRFQQNLADRPLGILVLPTNDWPTLRAMEARIIAAAASLKPGTVIVLPLTN